MAISPFDLSEDQAPPLDPMGVQAPVPEPPPPPAPMMGLPGAPPPVIDGMEGAPGAPPPMDTGAPLQWPDPAWLQPETHPLAVPQPAPEGPPVAMKGSPVEQEGPPVELQGSPPPPPPPVNPDPAMAQADRNAREHEQAVLAANEAEQQKNDFLSSEGVRAAEDAARQQAAADKAYLQANDVANAKRAKLDAEATAIANQQIDPKRAWHDASFGAKLGIGVAAIVQGMVAGALGKDGANPIIAMIQTLNEQDMKAQEVNLANRTNLLGVRRGLLADDVAAGLELRDFKYKSLNAAYTMAENQIKAYALKYDNPVINASAQDKLAQIHDARLKLGMDWHHETVEEDFKKQQLDMQRSHLAMQRRAAAAKQVATPAESAAMMNAKREGEKDRRERLMIGGRTADGRQLYAKDKDAATDINKKAAEVTKSVAIVDELSDIYARNGWNPLGKWAGGTAGKDAQRANFLTGKLMTDFSKKEGQGTIRDSEYKMYKDMFGDPTGLVDPRAAFGQVRQTFIDDVNDDIQGNALDEDGNVVEDTTYWQPRAHLAKPEDKDTAEGNYQGRDFEKVPMDKTGKIIDPREEEYWKRNKPKNGLVDTPRKLTPEEEMDAMYGTHQADKP